ncbi:hypothetical protein EDB19DRAFT_1738065 [Suillus lakei]|nr:hypothetical protein EDB19DRAFT_1738065 [Suillus lakei]
MLFLLNRYLALLVVNTSNLVSHFLPISDQSCSKFELYRQLALVFQGVIVCLIMTIRAYALYGGSKRLLAWMVIILFSLAVGVSVGTFGHFSGNATILPGVGCYEIYTADAIAGVGLAWVAEFVFELLTFILIVYRTCKTRSLLRLSLVTRRDIIDIIFRDGTMYFGVMALVNVPNILTYYFGSVSIYIPSYI